ncbi:MAG: hypothetical protein A2504_00695 [Bdellovibrionales bacterium RIFOXYD12_FULL_39_22]|nr:MAG: hypothetical protein A2385_03315 [Bdellovibrionales bacterium RIFOXYB1_FULL_39_21]OFZ42643.1 MAG: hypothetical protein A2485_09990 [Bdellovibrionales bacterium RIFOXYC12_FULL_39_17]OFZ47089.1 MAG: hypothetical protein A2404_15305 [Bdellovibrionales bacterium RIFOXYC1_FULL_39_130]OFZ75337.1 MAG: hypothetical protein A2560_14080 [Bdellovibrionales bacterium RIFOXYD1_FULL_39_84]OFZ93288.1 MAG: hypothetical protein A2504_00695 [Bdellovibrionales bacterium RIFOXYD12_FULL_39_22]HLE10037.1 hy
MGSLNVEKKKKQREKGISSVLVESFKKIKFSKTAGGGLVEVLAASAILIISLVGFSGIEAYSARNYKNIERRFIATVTAESMANAVAGLGSSDLYEMIKKRSNILSGLQGATGEANDVLSWMSHWGKGGGRANFILSEKIQIEIFSNDSFDAGMKLLDSYFLESDEKIKAKNISDLKLKNKIISVEISYLDALENNRIVRLKKRISGE